MTKRPKVAEAWAIATNEFVAACDTDPMVGELLVRAAATSDTDHREALVIHAASKVAALAPSLPYGVWRSMLAALTAGDEVRTTHVPGIAGATVWAIRDDADTEAMRAYVAPGQVWIRADLVTSDQSQLVWTQAMDAMERTIGKVRKPGPPKGSTQPARDALLDELAPTMGAMSDLELDAMIVDRGLWEARPGDYDVIAKRVSHFRADAASRLSNP